MDDSPSHDNDASASASPPQPPAQGLSSGFGGSPTDFLKGVVGKSVVVRLTSGVDYRGEYDVDISH